MILSLNPACPIYTIDHSECILSALSSTSILCRTWHEFLLHTLHKNKVQEAERQFNVKVDGIEAEARFTTWRMEGGWWGQNERVVLYSPNICFYTIFPYSELILSVNVVRVKLIRSHRNVLERRCRPEAFQCKLFSGGGGREKERGEK